MNKLTCFKAYDKRWSHLFEQTGVKVNGFILNDIQREAGGYGYGYNYAYAYKANKDDD